jgi:hypothetical protein
MKKLLLSVASFALVTFAAASTGHAAVTTNTWTPSAFTFVDTCTGESVLISGVIHSVATSTVTDNTISGTVHFQFKAAGVGLKSGVPYQEVVIFNRVFSTSLQNGEATITSHGVINVVSPGGGNNQWSPFFTHTTLDANGNLTSFKIDPVTVTCR